MIPMSSIPNFKQCIQSVRKHAQFQGIDSDGNPIMNRNVKYPIIEAKGTVKLHGTNSGISYNNSKGLIVQSKKRKLTPQNDNAGFASFIYSKKEEIEGLLLDIVDHFKINTLEDTVTVFSEWAGPGIQKGVGISEIPEKSMFIFGIKVTGKNNESYWIKDIDSFFTDIKVLDRVYALNKFPTFNVTIDFNQPELVNNEIVDIVESVEKECPVAKYFDISNTGEGVVFKFEFKDTDYLFKSKGQLHSKSKVKAHKKVDDVFIQKCIDVAEQVVPAWRLEQMYDETFDTLNGGEGDIKRTGEYIKSVIADVVKEEMITIGESGLELKQITKYISNIAKDYMFARMNEEIK